MADMIEKPPTAKAPEDEVVIHVMPEEFHSGGAALSTPASVAPAAVPVPPKPVPVPPQVTVVKPPEAKVVPAAIGKGGFGGIAKKPWFLPGAIGFGVVVIGAVLGLVLWPRTPEVAVVTFVCGNTQCEEGETIGSCPLDCMPAPVCGDSVCDVSETPESCPSDCLAKACGNGVCEEFEDLAICAEDCRPPEPQPGVDSDNDGLTDIEETTIYGSSPIEQDTDRDTFVDLNELYNLFDPAVPAPAMLATNPGITVYTSLDLGFSVLAPQSWTVTVNAEAQEVSFAPNSSERVLVKRVGPLADGETFDQWFIRTYAPNVVELDRSLTKSGYQYAGTDRMKNWFELDGVVYAMFYEAPSALTVEYSVTYYTMLMSVIPVK